QPEDGIRTQIAVKNLAVVANVTDDRHHKVVRQVQRRAEGRVVQAEQQLDVRVVGFEEFVDVLAGDAELFRLNQSVDHPAHNVGKLLIFLRSQRTQRFLADHEIEDLQR